MSPSQHTKPKHNPKSYTAMSQAAPGTSANEKPESQQDATSFRIQNPFCPYSRANMSILHIFRSEASCAHLWEQSQVLNPTGHNRKILSDISSKPNWQQMSTSQDWYDRLAWWTDVKAQYAHSCQTLTLTLGACVGDP